MPCDRIVPKWAEWDGDVVGPTPKPPFKYNEEKLLEEFKSYLLATYDGHYVGNDKIQSLDLIFAKGHGIGFTAGNILKYASRFGFKKGQERADILKILHYALLLLYLHDRKMNAT